MNIQGGKKIGNDEYHADRTAVSHSVLERFRESPRLYQQAYVTNTIKPTMKDYFEFGSAFHMNMLEPDEFGRKYAVAPERWKQNTTVGKESLKAFKEQHEGKTILWPDEFEAIDGMCTNAWADPLIKRMLEAPGLYEHAFYADVPVGDTGMVMPARCKTDKVFTMDGWLTVLDLKTTNSVDADDFARVCGNFGYHRQHALYARIIGQLNNLPWQSVRFLFLACCKTAPYDVRLFEVLACDVERGDEQNMADLQDLLTCRNFDTYLSPGADRVTQIKIPEYMLTSRNTG